MMNTSTTEDTQDNIARDARILRKLERYMCYQPAQRSFRYWK